MWKGLEARIELLLPPPQILDMSGRQSPSPLLLLRLLLVP